MILAALLVIVGGSVHVLSRQVIAIQRLVRRGSLGQIANHEPRVSHNQRFSKRKNDTNNVESVTFNLGSNEHTEGFILLDR